MVARDGGRQCCMAQVCSRCESGMDLGDALDCRAAKTIRKYEIIKACYRNHQRLVAA